MNKTIFRVFQDCAFCDGREEVDAFCKKHKMTVQLLPFKRNGASEIIMAAYEKGVSLPFFTDGETFSKNIEDFAPKPKARAKKKGGE